ncbi:hypothetical protein [Pseudonocardia zijingensis]|uniref:Secreted protein n=1 Tax=Pseudonocardia zijingensis TaxID=153376 RepID=A0ABP3YMZ7_9PSEU
MVETFVQVCFLCAVAFAAGSAVTWLLFVRRRPRRLSHPLFPPAPPRGRRAPGLPRPERKAPPEPPTPAEPALAHLDTHRTDRTPRRSGPSAAGALDRLGVAGGSRAAKPSDIPAQPGPVDEPADGDSR